MLALKTPLTQAQKVKQFLIKNNLFNKNYQLKKEFSFIYLPLKKLDKAQIKKLERKLKLKTLNLGLEKLKTPLTLKQLLKNKLTKSQLRLLPSSQEIIGSILILEIPKKLEKKEALIAQAFLQANKNIRTVVKKSRPHHTSYRLRKVKILAGEKTKETLHKENKVVMKIDIEKTYFSQRLATERLRIAKQIKAPESILVMFSGAATYPLVLAKNSPAKHITGIEINPLAHQLALENIKLNNLTHKISIFEGDVRNLLPKIKKKFERILMPLPKTSQHFLDLALKKSKPNTIIHFYAFIEEEKISQEAKKIKELCREYKHPVKLLRKTICGQFSPSIVRVCFDLKVLS